MEQVANSFEPPHQRSIGGPASFFPDLRREIRQWSKVHDIIPENILLRGLRLSRHDPICLKGGFSDIFLGEYRGRSVAIKRLRFQVYETPELRSRRLKVSYYYPSYSYLNGK
jgi:hypothetical protein